MPEQQMTISITAECSKMQMIAQAGKHQIMIDEPQDFGGDDTAANPLATLLASLAGCENATAQMIAKEMKFEIEGIEFDIKGQLDLQGLMGNPNVSPFFTSIEITAKVMTNESEERLHELHEKVNQRCPVYSLIEAAGVQMHSNWTK